MNNRISAIIADIKEECKISPSCFMANPSEILYLISKLEMYQEAERDGRILPLTVGSHIFTIDKGLCEFEVTGLSDKTCELLTFYAIGGEDGEIELEFETDQIGIDVFLTEQQANDALTRNNEI